jgi:class 3 adenylate cyclase/tetratricopeptide (TPR) repeat protein
MQQIADWLRTLGMSEYAERFAENDIDTSVLRDLTDQDLKELGVSLGHRRKMLRAIAEVSCVAPASPHLASTEPKTQDTAERRQVTVMFSDLVGSTALSARIDPEDLREVISAYQKCVAETVQRFGGFVAKFMGDGVLVYFGYPQAHEDDAERAVRAGLELMRAVGDLKTHAPLQTRVGIATGLVVVGDLIGSGASQEQAIVGETPNLAARLQGVAEPNAVVIAESTRRLVGSLFELEDLGAKNLKGVEGSVRAWAALRPSSVESRFDALHASGVTELVGREEELELLLRRWSKAKTGEGQVVLISGEPGIGKSRLTAALLERIAAEPHTRLRYFCSSQHTDSALYPIISQMERAAGFAHDDGLQTKLDKLDAVLALASTSKQDAALFAEMLSLPNDGRYPALDLTPEQRRQKTLNALTAQMEVLARQKSLLMIFEDAHWTDPTSLEAFGRTVDRIKSLRVFLIITYRPEFEPPWIGRPYVTALTINRLAERDIAALIDRVVGNNDLPANIRQDIIERTDGIPLFVEEMTKAVLEAEDEGATERAVAVIPSPSVAVPASLHASLMARLDRLGSAKEVAQIGAVIGREFPHALMAAVAHKKEAELRSALDRLIDAGLLFRQGSAPHATYLFKHALVQDAAYGTLLREPRRALHARIGETLESQFPEIAESQPELLARHYTEAGLIEKAARLWGTAGQRSLARSALVEAAEQLTRALAQIDALPATPELRREQIKLQAALITPLGWVKGPTAPETIAAAERACLLVEQAEARGEPPDDPLIQFSALYGLWNAVPFNGDVCRGLAAQFLALAAKQQTTAPRVIGHRMMGNTLFYIGEFVEAKAHLDKGLALYNAAEHRRLATRFWVDSRIVMLCWRSLAVWVLGYPATAISDSDQAIGDGRDIGQAGSLMYALLLPSYTHTFCGNCATATALLNEVTDLADEKGSLVTKALGALVRAEIFSLNDNATAALQSNIDGLNAFRSTQQTVFIPIYLSWLARTYAKLGRFDDAWSCIGEAVTAIETRKETWCEAEVNRVAGEIVLGSPAGDLLKAQAYFERALALAQQQQAKSWELRAAMSLARLWRDQGKVQQARELLAPVYGWFTEGFDTRDLKEAKALLREFRHVVHSAACPHP